MRKGTMLTAMISLATMRHADQFDRGGHPYILHPLTVMLTLRTDDEELQCIAVGHDLIEDCKVLPSELLRMGFTMRIVDGIVALTKRDDEPTRAYLERVQSNTDAIRVKLADIAHNSDLLRLSRPTARDIERVKLYQQQRVELDLALAIFAAGDHRLDTIGEARP